MADTPDPVITEWVPVWNLSNPGVIGVHAPTHGTGGSDPITDIAASVITSGTLNNARLDPVIANGGLWISVPFNAANFVNFTVSDMFVNRYNIVGKMVTWQLSIVGDVTLASTEMYLVPPVPHLAQYMGGSMGHSLYNGAISNSLTWFAQNGNSNQVVIRNPAFTVMNLGAFQFFGTIIYGIP